VKRQSTTQRAAPLSEMAGVLRAGSTLLPRSAEALGQRATATRSPSSAAEASVATGGSETSVLSWLPQPEGHAHGFEPSDTAGLPEQQEQSTGEPFVQQPARSTSLSLRTPASRWGQKHANARACWSGSNTTARPTSIFEMGTREAFIMHALPSRRSRAKRRSAIFIGCRGTRRKKMIKY